MEHSFIAVPPDAEALAGITAAMIADTIERLIAELDTREAPRDPETPMFPGGRAFVDLGDDLAGDPDDAEAEGERCEAADDCGTAYVPGAAFHRGMSDGAAGDPEDREDDDPRDTNGGEDEVLLGGWGGGPGCPISDPDAASWLDRRDQRRPPYGNVVSADFRNGEDAEDDDADQGGDEAEPDFSSKGGDGPGCRISDPGGSDLER